MGMMFMTSKSLLKCKALRLSLSAIAKFFWLYNKRDDCFSGLSIQVRSLQ